MTPYLVRATLLTGANVVSPMPGLVKLSWRSLSTCCDCQSWTHLVVVFGPKVHSWLWWRAPMVATSAFWPSHLVGRVTWATFKLKLVLISSHLLILWPSNKCPFGRFGGREFKDFANFFNGSPRWRAPPVAPTVQRLRQLVGPLSWATFKPLCAPPTCSVPNLCLVNQWSLARVGRNAAIWPP